MKNLVYYVKKYTQHMTFLDFALLKLCLLSMGTLLGLLLYPRWKKQASALSCLLFALTYPLLMFGFLREVFFRPSKQ